jgi:hypothetical protein
MTRLSLEQVKQELSKDLTIAVVIKIVCMSRHRKAEQASCKIRTKASPRFTRFGPLKLGFHSNVQAAQNSSAPEPDFKSS